MTKFAASMAIAASLLVAALPAHAGDPSGLWLTEDGEAKIRVGKCGAYVCGAVAWLKQPTDSNGKPKTDQLNADPGKRSRPIIGVPIVLSMKPDGAARWSGKVYNAEDGKIYNGSLTLADANTLKVQGCVAIACRTRTWIRTR
jgi:uncharacterized protein (DUF2147 family)